MSKLCNWYYLQNNKVSTHWFASKQFYQGGFHLGIANKKNNDTRRLNEFRSILISVSHWVWYATKLEKITLYFICESSFGQKWLLTSLYYFKSFQNQFIIKQNLRVNNEIYFNLSQFQWHIWFQAMQSATVF